MAHEIGCRRVLSNLLFSFSSSALGFHLLLHLVFHEGVVRVVCLGAGVHHFHHSLLLRLVRGMNNSALSCKLLYLFLFLNFLRSLNKLLLLNFFLLLCLHLLLLVKSDLLKSSFKFLINCWNQLTNVFNLHIIFWGHIVGATARIPISLINELLVPGKLSQVLGSQRLRVLQEGFGWKLTSRWERVFQFIRGDISWYLDSRVQEERST